MNPASGFGTLDLANIYKPEAPPELCEIRVSQLPEPIWRACLICSHCHWLGSAMNVW